MPVVNHWHCLVCREKMSLHQSENEDPADLELQNQLHILVATKCGHLFHQSCILKSCQSKKTHQRDLGYSVTEKDFCPSCDREIEIVECLRIYPTELREDGQGVDNLTSPELLEKIDELTGEIFKLKAQNAIQQKKIQALEKKSQNTSASSSSGLIVPPNDYFQIYQPRVGFAIETLLDGSPQLRLKRNDAVVWSTDDYPAGYGGVVRWLGKINSIIYAGVEFDDPIGNDFRESGGQILFYTVHPNHGRLVPVQALMLYKDFTGHDYYGPSGQVR